MPEIGYNKVPRLLPRHVNDAGTRQGAVSICLKLTMPSWPNALLVQKL